VLTLTRKIGQKILIGNGIEIVVREIRGRQVRLGITAPDGLPVYREELYQQIADENARAAASMSAVPLAAAPGQPVQLPLGMPGYPESTELVLRPATGTSFATLESQRVAGLRFAVIDVVRFVPEYPVDAVRKSMGFVGLEGDEPIDVLAICTLAAAPEQPTANLLAPVAIGRKSRRGAQVVLHDAAYDARHPIVEQK
jgi:carbon storage regulator CsrA